jgi:hypothetical protein
VTSTINTVDGQHIELRGILTRMLILSDGFRRDQRTDFGGEIARFPVLSSNQSRSGFECFNQASERIPVNLPLVLAKLLRRANHREHGGSQRKDEDDLCVTRFVGGNPSVRHQFRRGQGHGRKPVFVDRCPTCPFTFPVRFACTLRSWHDRMSRPRGMLLSHFVQFYPVDLYRSKVLSLEIDLL